MRYDRVEVTWKDAYLQHGESENLPSYEVAHSLGFLVSNGDECIQIAMTIQGEDEKPVDILVVPKDMVKSIERL